MSQAGSLCRDLGTLVERTKNELCDFMTTEPAWLAESFVIPGSRVEIQVITLARRPGG